MEMGMAAKDEGEQFRRGDAQEMFPRASCCLAFVIAQQPWQLLFVVGRIESWPTPGGFSLWCLLEPS